MTGLLGLPISKMTMNLSCDMDGPLFQLSWSQLQIQPLLHIPKMTLSSLVLGR